MVLSPRATLRLPPGLFSFRSYGANAQHPALAPGSGPESDSSHIADTHSLIRIVRHADEGRTESPAVR
jgi:hypothetical protein